MNFEYPNNSENSNETRSNNQEVDNIQTDDVILIPPPNTNTESTAIKYRPVLCFIPLRCGLNTFDIQCLNFVSLSVMLEDGLGFISGKNHRAYYVIGSSGDKFYYFDPHVTKTCVTNQKIHDQLFGEPLQNIPCQEISPSLMLGFFWPNPEEMEKTITLMQQLEFCPISFTDLPKESKVTHYEDQEWNIVNTNEINTQLIDDGFEIISSDLM